MIAEILSSPIALLASSEQIKPHISSLEHKIFSGQGKGGTGRTFTWGVDILKFFEKQKLSTIALEAGDEADVSSLSKSVGIKLVSSLRLLTAFPKSLVSTKDFGKAVNSLNEV